LLLRTGYVLALVALAVQLVLAELVVRRPGAARRVVPSTAIALSAAGTVAADILERGAELTPGLRGLQVACFGVALAGALVIVRAVTGVLPAERRRR
jgi:hypothetical protein